ncbi:MAG: N-acetylmuramoyl-L-alanine amidase [Candidatus Omnitrophota bacterium]
MQKFFILLKSAFFRWWFMVTLLYSSSTTCPCCGRQGCPVGLGFSAILGFIFVSLAKLLVKIARARKLLFGRILCFFGVLSLACLLSSCVTPPVPRQAAQPCALNLPPSLPPATRSDILHTVAPGENLWRISKMYDVPSERIISANNLVSKEPVLKKGQKLLIPGASPVAPVISLYASSKWKYIIIHHSATDEGNSLAFDKAHQRRGWSGLGYHFVIDNGTKGKKDGQIEVSPRWLKQKDGSHCRAAGMNSRAIGICLVGNFNNERPSAKQMESLVFLVNKLKKYYKIPSRRILGHGQVDGASTDCPGKRFPWREFYSRIE